MIQMIAVQSADGIELHDSGRHATPISDNKLVYHPILLFVLLYLEIVYIISHTFFMHVEDYRHYIGDY